ncbi:MAG: hypothetical protein Alpg2KO_24130 [Alphaproteobacteria bacterium]
MSRRSPAQICLEEIVQLANETPAKKNGSAPPDDGPIELSRFDGRWHELARTPNPFQDNKPRRNGKKYSECIGSEADYRITGDGEITLRNTAKRRAKDNSIIKESAEGFGKLAEGSNGRMLKVTVGSPVWRFFQKALMNGGASYRIFSVGPVNKDGKYDWAVVGSRRFAFLLTRDRKVSEETRKEIVAAAKRHRIPTKRLIYRPG